MFTKLFNHKYRFNSYGILNIYYRESSVWTSERVVNSPYKDIVVPEITIDEYIWRNLDKWPTKIAAVCGLTNRSYTYEQIFMQSRKFGANLRKRFKIKDGDTVALMLPNYPEFPLIVLGILAAGGIVTTLNNVFTAFEVKRQLQLSEAKLIIGYTEAIPVIKEALKLLKTDRPIIEVSINQSIPDKTVSYKELVEDIHVNISILKEVKTTGEHVAFLPYSSGTTGLPKGVELTNKNIVANCEQQNTDCRQYSYTTDTNQDRSLAILPMFHAYGHNILMLHKLSAGLKIVTLPKFQPETFLNALTEHRINLLYVAPPTVLFMGSHPLVSSRNLESLSCVMSGAAPLHLPDLHKFLDRAPVNVKFCQGYGMTEASAVVTVTRFGEKKHQEVGYAVPNIKLRIVDGDMKNLGPGEVGELLIKGPNIMKGYKNNSEANSEAFVDGTWCRSGDIGKIDEFGSLTILDRLKDLIKVKGYQVPTAELENVIKEHPAIFDAAVIGVPDSITGERPKAFVVIKEGANITSENIINFVSQRVAPYKKIKSITFLENIPKTSSGKILRRILKEEYS